MDNNNQWIHKQRDRENYKLQKILNLFNLNLLQKIDFQSLTKTWEDIDQF